MPNALRLSEAEWDALNKRRRAALSAPTAAPREVAASDRWPLVLRDQIVDAGLPEPFREFTFHATRGWRLDLAWPHLKRAIEVDGAVHRIKGRHLADIEKHNALVMAGWQWLRFTPRQVETREAVTMAMEWFQ